MVSEDRLAKGLYWQEALSLVEGCTPVSAGCEHCWAARATRMRAAQRSEKIKARYGGLTDERGQFTGAVRFMHADLDKPRARRRPAVFSVWNDLFHEDISCYDRAEAFYVMATERRHRFLILTKRPELMIMYLQDDLGLGCDPATSSRLDNVWFGITAETHRRFRERAPYVLTAKMDYGLNTFVSLEPLLGPVSLARAAQEFGLGLDELNDMLDCVIVGGESGPDARPMLDEWVRTLLAERGPRPAFVKQMGSWWAQEHGIRDDRAASRTRSIPIDLRRRELPWT